MKRAILLILLVFLISTRSISEDQWVAFNLLRGYLIVVKCSVGDLRDLACVVDTGVTETVVDTGLVKRLSLPTRADRAVFMTEEAPVSSVSIPSLQLGPLHTGTLAGIATDLSSLTHQFGIRPDVLIGMDVLHRANLVIDYKARQLQFMDPPRLTHSARLTHDERFALVESMVMGKRLLLQVDTGFPGLLLYRGRTGEFAGLSTRQGLVETAAHTLISASLGSREVRVGNWQTSHLEVSVVDPPGDRPVFDGLIGPQALKARRIAFDFANDRISWE